MFYGREKQKNSFTRCYIQIARWFRLSKAEGCGDFCLRQAESALWNSGCDDRAKAHGLL